MHFCHMSQSAQLGAGSGFLLPAGRETVPSLTKSVEIKLPIDDRV